MAYPAPRRLQLRRGNTSAVSAYLGNTGELVVNTDNWTLYVHDGVTVGGYLATVNTASINSNISSITNGTAVFGNIIPSANVTYSLGNITHQWRDLYVSNNTIFVGGVPLSIDATGNLTINGNVIPSIEYVNTAVANVTVDLSSYALNANVTAANVGMKGYVDNAVASIVIPVTYSNANVASYLPTYSGDIGANISKAGYNWTFGTNGNLQFPDGTIYSGSELVSPTVPTVGGTASAGEAGITYLTGELSKWAIFTEGAFTVGVWTDVQVGWTVTDNNGFTDTIAGRGSFGAASFQTTVNDWPAPASGKTYVFTSPDYQLGYTNPIEITVGSNDWTFGANGSLTFPDNTVQQTAFSNTASIITTIIANAATQSDLIIGINANVTAANVGIKGYVDSQNFYSNTKVATYLQVGGISNISVAGNVTATYFVGNGALLTGIAASSSYSNVQVATYLPTYTGTLAGGTLNLAGQDGTTVVDFQTGAATNQIITLGSNYTFSIRAGAAASNRGSLVLESGQNSRVRINGSGSNVLITAGNGTQSSTWTFANSGVLTFPDGTTQSTAASGDSSNYGNANVASYLPTHTGNVGVNYLLGTTPNVTVTAGTFDSVFDTTGNVILPTAYISGNVTAGYFIGNGALLTGIVSLGSTDYSNVNVKAYTETMGFQNYGNVNVAAYTQTVGYTNYSNVNVSAFITTNGLTNFSNVNVAAYLNTQGYNLYSNVNVAAYLSTYSGNVANVRLGTSGILTFPDGSQQTTAAFGGGSNYGNANVAAFLPTYTGTTGITQVGTLATLAVSGNATVGNLVGTEANTRIIANTHVTTFDIYGNVTFPANVIATRFIGNGALLTSVVTQTTGSWTVTAGTNTYSFTVPINAVYQIWVRGNIPNGIITYLATVSVTNTNVPVLGSQRAWNYTDGGSPILLTSMPAQIIGTEGTISNTVVSTTTANQFDFGISNTSGESQIVYWGYNTL
jgi:hypothetical protein